MKEVKANNPTYSADDIRGNAIKHLAYMVYIHFPSYYYIAACYTYYKSLCQEALKRKGTYEEEDSKDAKKG